MKRFAACLFAALLISGCEQDTATKKVESFIKNKDISLLSKSKTSQCSADFVKNFHYFDENTLPTTNKYYELSKYLYGKVKFEPVSEVKSGDATEVMVKVLMPKAIEDANSFIFANGYGGTTKDTEALDNLLTLYNSGKLKDMEYTTFDMKWRVLPDGIDPNYSTEQIKACSKK